MESSPTTFDGDPRSLHLVDLEALVGPDPSVEAFRGLVNAYLDASEWEPCDHVVVRAEHRLLGQHAVELDCGWRAQSAPLHDLHPRLVAGRHERLVIGAGHRDFAPLAAEVAALGTPVWVVAPKRALSPDLAAHAEHVVQLPEVRALHARRRSA
jgi:hypothetical protein